MSRTLLRPLALSRLSRQLRAPYQGLPRTVWMLALVIFVNRSGSMVLFFLTLYATEKLGLSMARAGTLVSTYGLGALFGSYLGGWLSDKWGTHRVQFWSLLGSGAGYIALGYMQTFLSLMIALFIVALVAETFRPANAAAVAEASPADLRARSYALNRLAVNLGIAVGPAVGGFLARIDYLWLFWADGLTYLASAFFFWVFVKQLPLPKHVDTGLPGQPPYKDRLFVAILILSFVMACIFFQLFTTWPLYLRNVYQLLEPQIGSLLAMNAVLIVLLEMPLVYRLPAKRNYQILSIGSFLLLIGFGLLPLGQGYAYVIMTVLIWTFGEMLVFPILMSVVANRASDRQRGQYMGWHTLMFSLGFVVGPTLGSRLFETLGNTWFWFGIGGLAIVVSSGFYGIHRGLDRNTFNLP